MEQSKNIEPNLATPYVLNKWQPRVNHLNIARLPSLLNPTVDGMQRTPLVLLAFSQSLKIPPQRITGSGYEIVFHLEVSAEGPSLEMSNSVLLCQVVKEPIPFLYFLLHYFSPA